jgi:Zn-dependent protease
MNQSYFAYAGYWIPAMILGITIHEFAHAFTAVALGDNYAKRLGRLSLNPLRHLTFFGTLAACLLPFGWGRAVPLNLYHFRHPRLFFFLVGLAGPMANILLAFICFGLLQITQHTFRFESTYQSYVAIAHQFFLVAMVVNLILAAFNLIPIPPMDGWRIWPCLLSHVSPMIRPRNKWVFVMLFFMLAATSTFKPLVDLTLETLSAQILPSDISVVQSNINAAEQRYADKRWIEAESLYSQILEIQPESHEIYHLRAQTRCKMKKWRDALTDIERAISLSPREEYFATRKDIYLALYKKNAAAAETQSKNPSLTAIKNESKSRPKTASTSE